MDFSTPNQKSQNNVSEWYLIDEYVFRGRIIDEEMRGDLTGRSLIQTIRDLGMPFECINNIKRTLSDFTKATRAQPTPEKPAFLVHIRLFCQRRSTDGEIPAQGSEVSKNEQAIGPTQALYPSHLITNGGWGYFLIERGEDSATGSSFFPHNCIDLYLYKEGQ